MWELSGGKDGNPTTQSESPFSFNQATRTTPFSTFDNDWSWGSNFQTETRPESEEMEDERRYEESLPLRDVEDLVNDIKHTTKGLTTEVKTNNTADNLVCLVLSRCYLKANESITVERWSTGTISQCRVSVYPYVNDPKSIPCIVLHFSDGTIRMKTG